MSQRSLLARASTVALRPFGTRVVTVRAGSLAGARMALDLAYEKSFWAGTYEPHVQEAMSALDLKGLTARLDYLNDGNPATGSDLGVTGLWLMPINPSPSYHGYDVTDYNSVNPDYGSLADLRALVSAAHQRGIAVILDMPFNHTSSQDPWFVDSQRPGSSHDNWYVWAGQPGGSNWFPNGKRFYYAAFGPDLPDLNYRTPAVTSAIDATARFWLGDVGVDGFRIDAAKYLVEDGSVDQNTPETHAWLQAFKTGLAASTPGKLLLGEVWDTSPTSASYVPNDLDMTFDFGLSGAYVGAANGGQAWGLAGIMTKVVGLYPAAGFGAPRSCSTCAKR